MTQQSGVPSDTVLEGPVDVVNYLLVVNYRFNRIHFLLDEGAAQPASRLYLGLGFHVVCTKLQTRKSPR